MFDDYSAVVGDGCPDGDCLSGNVASPVEPHPAVDGSVRHASQPQFVLNLAVERLLKTLHSLITHNSFLSLPGGS